MEKVWSIGTLSRTAWSDKGVFAKPYGTDFLPSSTASATPTVQGVTTGRGNLYAQESGNNADTSALAATLTSGDFFLEPAGENLMSISRFIPDFKALSGDIAVTIQLRDYPGDAKAGSPLGPFTVDSTTTFISTRARGRQVALKLNSSGTNDSWRFGTFRAGIQPSGRR